MAKLRNRKAFVHYVVARYHRAAATLHRDDFNQTVELACLMTDDDREAINIVRREACWLVGACRPEYAMDEIYGIKSPFGRRRDDGHEITPELWRIIDSLPDVQREAIVRVYLDDVPRAYVASELGMTGTKLHKTIRCGIEAIRRACKRQGISA